MSRKNQWRWIAALVAPMVAAAFTIGGGDALGGQRSNDPCQPAPTLVFPCEPSDPGSMRAPLIDGQEMVPPATAADEVATDSVMPPASTQSMIDSDFNDFDLSSGLATNFGAGGAGSLAFADTPVPGYIESAVIQTRLRVRYDNAQGANKATRGGFLYPTPRTGNGYTGGRGPDTEEYSSTSSVDLEELSFYYEHRLRERFSVFFDIPMRWYQYDTTVNFIPSTVSDRGLSDIRVGARWGWIANQDEHLTFQFRTWLPTGESSSALGTGNTAIDIGLYYDQRCFDRTIIFAEINDWFTVDAVTLTANPASGSLPPELLNQDANILRAGVGIGFDLLKWGDRCNPRSLTLLAECVGWTVLDGVTAPLGRSFDPIDNSLSDATGDTIVNGKYGARWTLDQSSLYVGYGHNWTEELWYTDLIRVEWQRNF